MLQLPWVWSFVYWLPQETEVWTEGTWTTDWTEPEWFRKCLAWRQVSPPGGKDVNMVEIDLSKLLGGQGFHINSQLAYNGLSFPMTTLADTGANGYLFMNTRKAIELVWFHNIPTEWLEQPARTKGFSGMEGPQISYTIKMHFIVGGWWFLNQPFLILNLGQHDVIIGRWWFE